MGNLLVLLVSFGVGWGKSDPSYCTQLFVGREVAVNQAIEQSSIFEKVRQTLQSLYAQNTNQTKRLTDLSGSIPTQFTRLWVYREGEKTKQGHEFTSSRKYAHLHLTETNEKLLLFNRYRRFDTPGFDGIIYDRQNRPVVNYTLKKHSSRSVNGIFHAIEYAIKKADRFSYEDSWVQLFMHFHGVMSDYFDQRANEHRAQRSLQAFAFMMENFGVNPHNCFDCVRRKTRVVIHWDNPTVYPDKLIAQVYDDIANLVRLNQDTIESVVLFNDHGVVEITGSDYYLFDGLD